MIAAHLPPAESANDARLLRRVVRFNLLAIAITIGLMTGAILWLATAVLLLKGGENIGMHLGLLSVFLPGYEVTWSGAWVGLIWGFVAGAASGAVLYWTYAKGLREGAMTYVVSRPALEGLRPPVLLMDGPALGIGLGTLGALQLLLATNWLVVRGTASYSRNAALLGEYLPGYSVSALGSLIGVAQVFALAFIASMFIALVYNAIARGRAEA